MEVGGGGGEGRKGGYGLGSGFDGGDDATLRGGGDEVVESILELLGNGDAGLHGGFRVIGIVQLHGRGRSEDLA